MDKYELKALAKLMAEARPVAAKLKQGVSKHMVLRDADLGDAILALFKELDNLGNQNIKGE